MPTGRISIPGALTSDGAAASAESDSDVSSVASDAVANDDALGGDASDGSLDSDEFLPTLDPPPPQAAENAAEDAAEASADVADAPVEVGGRRTRRKRRSQSPESQLARARALARRFAAAGRPNNAIRQLVRATALAVIARGPTHREFAASYEQLARGYLELKGHAFAAQAHSHASHATRLLSDLPPPSDAPTEQEQAELLRVSLDAFHTLGRAQSLLKQLNEAERSLLEAERLASEFASVSSVTFEESQEAKLRVFTSLAKLSARLQKPAVSISYYEQAMAACQALHGNDSERMVPLLHGVAGVEQSRPEFPNHQRAVELCSAAHDIAVTAAHGSFTPLTAVTSRALATAYGLCEGAEASAESFLQESLSALLHLHGPEHSSVCEVKEELGKLMLRCQRQQEGAKLLRETLRLKAGIYGDISQEVLDSYRLLGSLALSQGKLEKALQELQKAKDIGDVLLGQNSRVCRDLAATIQNILKHPSMEGRQAGHEMRSRPRFNGIVGRSRAQQQAGAATGVFN